LAQEEKFFFKILIFIDFFFPSKIMDFYLLI